MIPVELVAHGADLEPRGQFEIVPASGSSSPLASLCPAVGVGATDTAGAAGPVHDPLAGWSGGCRGRLLFLFNCLLRFGGGDVLLDSGVLVL